MEVNLGDSENNTTSDDNLATVDQSNERDKATDSDCGENRSSDNGDSDNATAENTEAKQSGVLKTNVKSDETVLDKLKCSKDLNDQNKVISNKNESLKELISASKSSDSNVTSPNSLEDEEVDEQDLDLKDFNNEDQLIKNVKNFYPEIEFSKTSSDIIQEGKAFIIKQSNNVFYNPVQEFNRDLSVSAVSVFAEEHQNDPRCRSRGTKRKANDKEDTCNDNVTTTENRKAGVKYDDGIVILEALSATGLRSIRYAKEVPGVKEVVANDISLSAVVTIKNNIEYNGVEDLVTTSHNDASLFMYTRKAQNNFFDVVDLDPYGCPSRFLDAAVQCVRDGGLLLVTCTDMAVLAGNSPETCYVKYGAISLRNTACHEMALRITLQCIESHANRYGRYIVPQVSFSADFYIRVIVKVYTSPAMCKKTTSKLSTIYQCVGCQTFSYWPLGVTENCNNNVKYHLSRGPPVTQSCQHCGSVFYQGGPIWSAPLHNTTFVEKMLLNIYDQDFNTEKRMEGMLELIREELSGSLLYYTIDSLCSKVHCEVIPRNKFVSALLHANYKVTLSHAAPNSIKTNAPAGIIWDIIRCWVKDHPVNLKRLVKGSIAEKLLDSVPRLQANFELHPEVMPRNRKKILRYQQNPQPFWGPGTRDKTNCTSEDKMSKSFANQNKKHKRSNIKAQMKAAINSKTIDIIEVVTLTDDDDDDDNNNEEEKKLSNSKKEKVKVNDSSNDDVKTEPVIDEGNENNVGDYDNIDSIKNEKMDEDSLNKLKKSSSEDDCKTNDVEEKLKTENLNIDETNSSNVET